MIRREDKPKDVLQERARRLAQRDAGVAVRKAWQRLVVVESGRERYGIPATSLRALVRATPITPLPGLPAFMLGIACSRGELVSVIDLAELRGSGRTGTALLFALVEAGPRTLAIGVESVLGFRDVFEDELASSLLSAELEQAFTKAVTNDLICVLDVERLLCSERLVVGQANEQGPDPHESAT